LKWRDGNSEDLEGNVRIQMKCLARKMFLFNLEIISASYFSLLWTKQKLNSYDIFKKKKKTAIFGL